MNQQERITGAVLGLACGDALGAPAEHLSRETILQTWGSLREMLGSEGRRAGEWTDDTDLSLCVAAGIIEDPDDPITGAGHCLITWSRNANGVGATISAAINAYKGDWFEAGRRARELNKGRPVGNGSLMRTLPVALAYPAKDEMLRQSARLSAMTHWDPEAESCCAVYCLWVRSLLEGKPMKLAWS